MEEHRVVLHIFMNILLFLGFCGNILSILFFSKRSRKSPTVIMIRYLSIVDLVVCILAVVTLLYFADVHLGHRNTIMCKTINFMIRWFVMTSVLILGTISIERYRKMCKPRGWQFSNRAAILAMFIMSMISMIVSTQNIALYEVISFNTTANNQTETYLQIECTFTKDERLDDIFAILRVLDAFIIMAIIITFVVTYGAIWYTLRKHNNSNRVSNDDSNSDPTKSNSTHSSGLINLKITNILSSSQINNSQFWLDESNETVHNDSTNNKVSFGLGEHDDSIAIIPMQNVPSDSIMNINKATAKKLSKTIKTERRLTAMMFAINVAFCACFIPYSIVTFYYRPLSREPGHERRRAWVNFAMLSPFWNSAVNPYIFCVFNSQYRKYVKNILTKCCKLFHKN